MLGLHFTPVCVLLLVCSLHFTLSLHFTPGPQSAFYTDRKRKRCHPNGFPTLISDAFFDQKPNKPQVAFLFAVLLFMQINKPAMNNRRFLMAAVFHFAHIKHITSWPKTLSASAVKVNKLISRCCINFPHELSCQILTNQSIKIGRRAWPTRDHG